MASLYLPPSDFWTRGGTVTTTVGATDSDYTDDWLVDDKPNVPARGTSGTVTWSIASSSGSVSGIVIANHNIDGARTITIGGGITATGAAPASRANSIPYNAYIAISPTATGVTGFTVGVSGNSANLTIGEVVAGVFRSFPGRGLLMNELGGSNLNRGNGAQSLSVTPYDTAEAQRMWRSKVVATASELDDMMAWFEAQRNESRFSVFIPDSTVNDAWLVYLQEPEYELLPTRIPSYRVTINLIEIPRVRW